MERCGVTWAWRGGVCPYPLVASFSARVVLLGEVPQIVVVVEVEKLHQVLKYKDRKTKTNKAAEKS